MDSIVSLTILILLVVNLIGLIVLLNPLWGLLLNLRGTPIVSAPACPGLPLPASAPTYNALPCIPYARQAQ